ncbi:MULTISPECIES: ABC transporter permease [unclassified Pedobacter]|uniref:ABC transporter permease n=1 Tax=unclassified Pedobacter TaxID=2628915 RepID=UPI00141F105C|nr:MULTISPECIES: ABC transporter permease [unclassified Pedobacter]NII81905.1 ABC-type antimicrobial peptide transport system permease subunit [Pedobacter sp. SG908]NMN35908.1 ABC-type antimicrobial peptide transport system permease subunit [Pedobacter sp. SG918]
MFKLNLKIALRNLWRNKGFTLINLGGLAIGLASCMVLLLYVAYEYGYDKQFTDYDKTYLVYNNQKTAKETFSFLAVPGLMENEVRSKVPGVSKVGRLSYPEYKMLSYHQNNFKKSAVFADPDFLKMFDYKILKGNPNTFLKNPDGVILSETLAKNLFGNEDPLNKVVKLENNLSLKVEGVIEDRPKNSSLEIDYLMSWKLYETLNPWTKTSGWTSNYCVLFVQLQDNSFFEQANNQMHGMIKANDKNSNGEPFLHPLSKWHLYEKFENGKNVGGRIDQLKIFFLLAFCILLIACVNFMNLSTAKSEKRAREVGVRKAIGSSRSNLVSQFMFESILLTMLSMLVAFVLIEVSLPYFNNLLGISLEIDYSDWKFWAVFLGLTLLTGIIAGSYPAFYLSSFDPVKVLKGFKLSGGSSLSIRKYLVVFQFVFAACLIVCTAVIYQQLNFIKNKPIGYNIGNLVQIPAEGEFANPGKRNILKDELLKSGAVTAVTEYSQSLTAGGNNTYAVSWPGKDENEKVLVNYRFTTVDLTKATGMEILAGRDFSKDRVDTANVLVNEALVKVMGMKNPVGKVISWDQPLTIVGVVKDYVMESPYQSPKPLIIAQNKQAANTIIMRLNEHSNVSSSINAINEIIKKLNPAFPTEVKFVNENFESKFKNEKLLGTLSNWFGGFAIFISCLGLLGLALFMAEQRKKEISIRKVLGASTANILTLLNKDFIKLVAIANVIAFPLAYVIITKWLSGYEYRIAVSALPFIAAISLSVIIAILTVSIQSVKVAKANPVDALKYE